VNYSGDARQSVERIETAPGHDDPHLGLAGQPGAERERRLSLLLEVGRSLVSELELDVVLERVLDAARELTGARYAAIGVLDEDRKALERFITLGIDDETHRAIGNLPSGRGVLGVLITDPRPLRLDDVGRHPHSFGFPPAHPPMSSFLGVPILVRGQAYGNLYLTEKHGGVFETEDEEAVVVLAEWAAVAIDNARAYASAESRRAELERAVSSLEATTAIAQTLAGETDLDNVLELVVKRARALTDARAMVVLLPRGDDLAVMALAGDLDHELLGERIPIEGSVSGEVFRSGRPERLADASSRLRVAFEKQTGATTGLVVALRFRGRSLGVLAAFDRLGAEQEFSPRDEHVLTGFAASAAAAIATAQDVAEQTGRRSIAAAESERARWARELHDDTLQELAALKLLLAAVRRSDDAGERQTVLREATERIDYAIRSLRGLITDLRPAALDDLGLGPALDALSDRVAQASGITVELNVDFALEGGRETTRLTREVEEGVYRLVQECLANVVKHAHASRVDISVRESAETVDVEVRDDGQGFDDTEPSDGFGLVGMRERVALVGGTMTIDTSPGAGTVVRLRLPVARAPAGDISATGT
jgi:signal transduction histidine kinase